MRSCLRRLTLLLCLVLGACTSTLKVTYQSDPPGASLFQNGQLMGYTPYTLQYQLSDDDRRQGVKLLQGTSVKWASGASANVPNLTANLTQFGLTQHFTFQRPDVPGRETDMQFALELQKLAIMRQQAQAQSLQAQAQAQQAKAQQDQAFYQLLQTMRPTVRPTTNCTSTVIGSIVQTNCY